MEAGAIGSDEAAALVCVAKVTGAHGVRGAVRLRCFTEAPQNVAAYGPVCDHAGRELFALTVTGPAKGGVIARVVGIEDRDAAEALAGLALYIPRDRLPEPDEDEFYEGDLIGLTAVDCSGAPRGRVVAVHDFGAGEIVEIAGDGESLMLPFTRESVPEIDLTARRVVIDPPTLS